MKSKHRSFLYYDERPEEAFRDDAPLSEHAKIYDHGRSHVTLMGIALPAVMSVRVDRIRRYFKVLDRFPINPDNRRRLTKHEYPHTALKILDRVDRAADTAGINIGSQFFGPIAWASFGPNLENAYAQNFFESANELPAHYDCAFEGPYRWQSLYVGEGCHLLRDMARRFRWSTHKTVAIALLLLHDILKHSGPDCTPLFDLFTNRYDARSLKDCEEGWKAAWNAAFQAAQTNDRQRIIYEHREYRNKYLFVETSFEEIPCPDANLERGEQVYTLAWERVKKDAYTSDPPEGGGCGSKAEYDALMAGYPEQHRDCSRPVTCLVPSGETPIHANYVSLR